MRTSLEIEDRLFREAKRAAAERGATLRELVESGLRRELRAHSAQHGKIAFGAAGGKWPAKLDLASREAMWHWIEGRRS